MSEIDWDWYLLSENILMVDIGAHPGLPWDMGAILHREDTTVDTLLALERAGKVIPWDIVSRYIDIQEVRDHPSMPWNRKGISRNSGITLWDVLHLNMPEAVGDWDWYYLSRSVPVQDIVGNPEQPWVWNSVAMNKGMTIDMAHRLLSIISPMQSDTHIWAGLSGTLPMSYIVSHPDRPWRKWYLSRNKGITYDAIQALSHVQGIWLWSSISKYVPVQDAIDHPSEEWDWYDITARATTDQIVDNPTLPWDMQAMLYDNDSLDLQVLENMGMVSADDTLPIEEIRLGMPEGINMTYAHGLTIEDVLYLNV